MKHPSQPKVFCIGRNKTGTTSVEAALRSLGFAMGSQTRGERLIDDWAKYDFRRIIELCRTADAFQDVPFSLGLTYAVLDVAFPGSKFILTVRNSANEWFDSLTGFHTNLIGKGRLPTGADLRACRYHKLGWLYRAEVLIYGIPESLLYDRDLYMRHYEAHNRRVMQHFCSRQHDLLVLNLSEPEPMRVLCEFLGIEFRGQIMPHLNHSSRPIVQERSAQQRDFRGTAPTR